MKKILITGGAGFIGLNLASEFLEKGHFVVIIDDFKNSYITHIKNLQKHFKNSLCFFKANVCNKKEIEQVFKDFSFDIIIHLAAKKYIRESIVKPKEYMQNNMESLKVILDLCDKYKIKTFAFASTVAIYGNNKETPFVETLPYAPLSPYAESKVEGEKLIKKYFDKTKQTSLIFRFANPVGANVKYMLGDHSKKKQDTLIPYIIESTLKEKHATFKHNNFLTPDGTSIREYIHIVDLAKIVTNILLSSNSGRFDIINVGSNEKGTSVLNVVKEVEKETNKKLDYSFTKASESEMPQICLNTSKLKTIYKQTCKLTLNDMIKSQLEFFNSLNKN